MIGKGFANFNQEITQLAWLSDNIARADGLWSKRIQATHQARQS